MTRSRNPERNTPRQDEFIAKGRAAALDGIGVADRTALQAAFTAACGPYAIGARSAWLVGHEQVTRELDALALDAASLAAARQFTAAGFTIQAADWPGRLTLHTPSELAVTVTVHDVTQPRPETTP